MATAALFLLTRLTVPQLFVPLGTDVTTNLIFGGTEDGAAGASL